MNYNLIEQMNRAMNYIDEHVKEDTASISAGCAQVAGWNENLLKNVFVEITGERLMRYIKRRKLYFMACELCDLRDKSLLDIALDYGYSEQSAFSRDMKIIHSCSPTDVRNGNVYVPNNKFHIEDYLSDRKITRLERIERAFEGEGVITPYAIELLMSMEEAENMFGFDTKTCTMIADLAEELDVPFVPLANACAMVYMQTQEDKENHPEFLLPSEQEEVEESM